MNCATPNHRQSNVVLREGRIELALLGNLRLLAGRAEETYGQREYDVSKIHQRAPRDVSPLAIRGP